MPDLQVHIENKIVPIDTLIAHRRNYRNHPDAQISQLKTSYRRFGQFRSVVALDNDDGTYTLLAGHGIVEAMRREGVTNVRIDALPSSLSENDAIGIMVADNNLDSLAVDDDDALAELLQGQKNAGYDLASLGSDDESLRQLLASLDEDIRDSMKVNQERTYEKETLDGSDRQFGKTPEEYLERYETTDIRQIILIYDKAEYIRIMRIFDKIRKQNNLETNTDVVTMLLEQYTEEHGLEEYDA